MKIPLIDTLLFMVVVTCAISTAYVRISSTLMGYEIGESKDKEAMLLQEQSQLKMELAKLSGKKNLSILAARAATEKDRIESLASY